MQLKLSDEEKDTLRLALESYLSDLRMEICDTEKLELRLRLKADARRLTDVVRRLGEEQPVAAGG